MSEKTVEIVMTLVALAIIVPTVGYILWKAPLTDPQVEPEYITIPDYYNVDPQSEPSRAFRRGQELLRRIEDFTKNEEIVADGVEVEIPESQSP